MSKVYRFDEDSCDTVIISDLHLGSVVSRAEDARHMLQSKRFRRLVLLGDIFCDLDFRRLTKEHWGLLSYIRKLSNPKRKYQWDYAGKRYLAIHGHQYDTFLVGNAALTAAGEWAYMHLQKLDSKSKLISRFLDRQNSKWMHLSPKVAAGALALASQKGADVVFCGHTHMAMQAERKGIRYFNSGCWTTEDPTYITVDEFGVQLHDYVSEQANRALDLEPAV
jgi:UDP-2,3-diacylglucosamine pyrophosphatase LpxH